MSKRKYSNIESDTESSSDESIDENEREDMTFDHEAFSDEEDEKITRELPGPGWYRLKKQVLLDRDFFDDYDVPLDYKKDTITKREYFDIISTQTLKQGFVKNIYKTVKDSVTDKHNKAIEFLKFELFPILEKSLILTNKFKKHKPSDQVEKKASAITQQIYAKLIFNRTSGIIPILQFLPSACLDYYAKLQQDLRQSNALQKKYQKVLFNESNEEVAKSQAYFIKSMLLIYILQLELRLIKSTRGLVTKTFDEIYKGFREDGFREINKFLHSQLIQHNMNGLK